MSLAIASLLAVYFVTQVMRGDGYRNVSDANRATNSTAR
jgi:hypothetical protein